MIVVDASVIVAALGDDGPEGQRYRDRLSGEDLAAPDILDLEVISAWRRVLRNSGRGESAVHDLGRLRIARAPHLALLGRCWELRANLTPYDAAYVALAEILDTTLLTADRRLAAASGPRCRMEVID